eukprot:13691288-Ditylum_brightwellii.AAC.1
MTPTSKCIVVKFHWFRQHVESGEVEIVKVETSKQLADIFTKGLQGDKSVAIRKLFVDGDWVKLGCLFVTTTLGLRGC